MIVFATCHVAPSSPAVHSMSPAATSLSHWTQGLLFGRSFGSCHVVPTSPAVQSMSPAAMRCTTILAAHVLESNRHHQRRAAGGGGGGHRNEVIICDGLARHEWSVSSSSSLAILLARGCLCCCARCLRPVPFFTEHEPEQRCKACALCRTSFRDSRAKISDQCPIKVFEKGVDR